MVNQIMPLGSTLTKLASTGSKLSVASDGDNSDGITQLASMQNVALASANSKMTFGSAKDIHQFGGGLHKEFTGVDVGSHWTEEAAKKWATEAKFTFKDDAIEGKVNIKGLGASLAKAILGDQYTTGHSLELAIQKALNKKAGKLDGEVEFKELKEAVEGLKDQVGISENDPPPKMSVFQTIMNVVSGVSLAVGLWALYRISQVKKTLENLGQSLVSTMQDLATQMYSVFGETKKLGTKFKQMLGIQGNILGNQDKTNQVLANMLGVPATGFTFASAPSFLRLNSNIQEMAANDDSDSNAKQAPQGQKAVSDAGTLNDQEKRAKQQGTQLIALEQASKRPKSVPVPVSVTTQQGTPTRRFIHDIKGVPPGTKVFSLGGRQYRDDRVANSGDRAIFWEKPSYAQDAANDSSYGQQIGNGTYGA